MLINIYVNYLLKTNVLQINPIVVVLLLNAKSMKNIACCIRSRGGPILRLGFSILSMKRFRWVGGSEHSVQKGSNSERIERWVVGVQEILSLEESNF